MSFEEKCQKCELLRNNGRGDIFCEDHKDIFQKMYESIEKEVNEFKQYLDEKAKVLESTRFYKKKKKW